MVHFRSHTCKLGSMILMVLIYFIVELIVGYALHSITLVADSFHMLSDFIALIIGIAARRIGKWPKSNKNTFGWQRAEVVGTLLNTVMLTTLTFTILIQTIQRFIQPERIERPKLLLGVGIGGLLINIIGMIILGGHHGHSHGGDTTMEVLIKDDEDDLTKIDKNDPENINVTVADGGDINEVGFIHSSVNAHNGGHGHSHEGVHGHSHEGVHGHSHEGGHGHSHEGGHSHSHEGGHNHSHDEVSNGTDHKKNNGHSHGSGSMNLRAVFLHVLADFFGSVAVVISALIIWLVPDFTNNLEGDAWKNYIDPSISLLMVFLILLSTIPLLKKSALILLQSVPKEVSVTKLKERMETIDGIDKVHDLHVWQLQSDVIIGTVHIRCANENYVTVSKKAKKLFHDFNIHCTTIQAEFNEHLEDSNSNHSMEGGTNDDECVLFCDDKSTVTGSNECKGKQSCCPTRNTSNVALNARIVDTPMIVRVHPVLQHQQSAPCLTSMVPVTQSSNIQLENIKEKQ